MEERQEQRKERKSLALILLLLLITCISIGYAALSSSLNISGSSTINDAEWDVGPTNPDDIECPTGKKCTINPDNPDDVDPTDPTDPSGPGSVIWMDGDTVYFKHVLSKPGDVFTFTTKYANNGTIDAKVSNVTTNELNATAKRFIDYSVTYADGSEIKKDDLLKAGQSATFKVTVSYKNVSTLPTAAELALINETADGHTGATSLFTVNYVQA